jgi:hypothetical protein
MKERRRRTVKDGQASKLRQRSVEIMMAPRSGDQDGVIRRRPRAMQDAAAMVSVKGMWS